jgi:hypothetical protein
MTKQITTYKELLAEKERLHALLAEQKLLIKEDWHAIKEDLKPSFLIASTIKKLFTRKASGILGGIGITLLADGLIKRVFLAGAGRFTKWVVPFFVKNYASHLAEEPHKLMNKIKHFFKKNGKMHHEAGMDAV